MGFVLHSPCVQGKGAFTLREDAHGVNLNFGNLWEIGSELRHA